MDRNTRVNFNSAIDSGASMRTIVALSVLAGVLALSACQRYALDRQMAELCKKDAGVKVYEAVQLSPIELEQLSKYATAKSKEDYYGPAYRYVNQRNNLIGTDDGATSGKGRLFRSHSSIYRRSDNRLLGESVNYFRTGGDGFTGGSHPSSASCSPDVPDIGQSVFIKVK